MAMRQHLNMLLSGLGFALKWWSTQTYHCLIAFLALHDKAVMMPPEEEKERAKEYVKEVVCLEWQNRFLLTDGAKFMLFQKPGLYGDAWFDKNKNNSIDCQIYI